MCQFNEKFFGADDRGVEIGQRSTVGRGPEIEESGVGGFEDLVSLQGFDQSRPTVFHEPGLEGAAPGEREHRLAFAGCLWILDSGDRAHLDVVNGRDEVGLTTGVTNPLFESTTRVATVHRYGAHSNGSNHRDRGAGFRVSISHSHK